MDVCICVCMYVLIMDVAFPHMWYVVAYMLCRSCDALLVLCHILALVLKYMLHGYFWCATACGLVDCVLCLMALCYVAVCALVLGCRLWDLVHCCFWFRRETGRLAHGVLCGHSCQARVWMMLAVWFERSGRCCPCAVLWYVMRWR